MTAMFRIIIFLVFAALLNATKMMKVGQRVAASFAIFMPLMSGAVSPIPALAIDVDPVVTMNGQIQLSSVNIAAPTGDKSALYITVREDVGVWTSAVRNMKPPPIMTKRMTNIKNFPVSVTLNSKDDMTQEGAASADEWMNSKRPLIISSRLDSDGVASTRSPEDLVGQGEAKYNGNNGWESFSVDLSGRGVAGKFITNQK
jgi:hypothetical protein